MVKGTGLKKRRPLFRLYPLHLPVFILCTFQSSSSAPSRLRPLHLPAFIPCCLLVFILCAFPSFRLHLLLPSTSLTLPSPYPPTSTRYRLVPSHLASIILPTHPLARAKTSGLATLRAENAVSPAEHLWTNNVTWR